MKKGSQTAKEVLKALDYTPTLLAEDMGITLYKAKRIMSQKGTIQFDEFLKILDILKNATPNLLLFGRQDRDALSNDKGE